LSQIQCESRIRLEVKALGPLEHLGQVAGPAPADVGVVAVELLEEIGWFITAAEKIAESEQHQDCHKDNRAGHQKELGDKSPGRWCHRWQAALLRRRCWRSIRIHE